MVEQIIIDTNFILTCVKQKIQMFEELEELFGVYELIVGRQIFNELDRLKDEKELKIKEREAAEVALKLLKLKKSRIKIIDFNSPCVDTGIVFYAAKKQPTKKQAIIIATLDRELKNRILRENKGARFLAIRQGKRIVIA